MQKCFSCQSGIRVTFLIKIKNERAQNCAKHNLKQMYNCTVYTLTRNMQLGYYEKQF